jgi:hypothetical protein
MLFLMNANDLQLHPDIIGSHVMWLTRFPQSQINVPYTTWTKHAVLQMHLPRIFVDALCKYATPRAGALAGHANAQVMQHVIPLTNLPVHLPHDETYTKRRRTQESQTPDSILMELLSPCVVEQPDNALPVVSYVDYFVRDRRNFDDRFYAIADLFPVTRRIDAYQADAVKLTVAASKQACSILEPFADRIIAMGVLLAWSDAAGMWVGHVTDIVPGSGKLMVRKIFRFVSEATYHDFNSRSSSSAAAL